MNNSEQPAFPKLNYEQNQGGIFYYQESGLTKREYFAAMAMQGLCANPKLFESEQSDYVVNGSHINLSQISRDSIKLADELLKQLENQQP